VAHTSPPGPSSDTATGSGLTDVDTDHDEDGDYYTEDLRVSSYFWESRFGLMSAEPISEEILFSKGRPQDRTT